MVTIIKMESSPSKTKIKCAPSKFDDHNHPQCPHGPCLLFYQKDENEGFFGCAAFRNRNRDCNFYLPVKYLTEKHLKREYEIDTQKFRDVQDKIFYRPKDCKVLYCQECNEIVLSTESKNSECKHKLLIVSEDQMNNPTTFLKPLDNDKGQAQYFFDEKALNFFGKCFTDLEINKVVCIGAPRLHAYLLNNYEKLQIRSYLLDLDFRFYYFYNDSKFAWFNMGNNHFFDEKQEFIFHKFLQSNDDERILFFTDPPFGCRTEPIAQTLRQLTKLFNKLNNFPHQPLPIFWIFPYFSAFYIQNQFPALEMCDYKVNYTNHIAYSDSGLKGNRKLGSPVRIFTNVPLEQLKLPVDEGYKYCAACKHYTALENRHCKLCGRCPSKNGSTYRHCDLCGICTKPNYVHCTNCRRCTQVEGHNCKEYQQKQRCWICNEFGHTERLCEVWAKATKRLVMTGINKDTSSQICCLLCGGLGHNERSCGMRKKYLEETTFLGITSTRLVNRGYKKEKNGISTN